MPSTQARPNVFLQPAPSLNPLTAFSQQRFIPSAEEDEEFRLTVGDMSKKRGFSIFQDIPENSPGRTETPLEDHRYGRAILLSIYYSANEIQTQIRFPIISRLAFISQQFDDLKPCPCVPNSRSQANYVSNTGQGERQA